MSVFGFYIENKFSYLKNTFRKPQIIYIDTAFFYNATNKYF